jgi:hypothetical protein
MKTLLFLPRCLFLLTGCAGLTSPTLFSQSAALVSREAAIIPPLQAKPIYYQVTHLAQPLFDTASSLNHNRSLAAGTILPVQYGSGNELPYTATIIYRFRIA